MNKDFLSTFPWFPNTIGQLDICSKNVLMYGSDLDADHPGFKDEEYRKRRQMFADIALQHRHGDNIPKIDYTSSEIETWSKVFEKLSSLYPDLACQQYLEHWSDLEQIGYTKTTIPQLTDVSNYLQEKTGFTLKPVAGYLTPRDFLTSLAFRVFHCTQYIRHGANPSYTPEPDCCHELLGHVPLLADMEFANFSQEIGLCSLGASEENVRILANIYFFSIEFGICIENGKRKAYGAGLLSSAAELQFAICDTTAKIDDFNIKSIGEATCQVTQYQDRYFVSNSFEEARRKLRLFAESIKPPFLVKYEPLTRSIDLYYEMNDMKKLYDEVEERMIFLKKLRRIVKEKESHAVLIDRRKMELMKLLLEL
ncbi:hypothetical protein SNEBB_006995 [Seison nebaliae]|nr:hypothetical protein SNEBB_006995 [Seison nebaliae]